MKMALWWQYAVIALAVLVSAWVVFKKQFPMAARRLRVALARWLLRAEGPAWRLALGRSLSPPATMGMGTCEGCDRCGPPTPPQS